MFEGNRNDDMTFSYVDFRYGLKKQSFFKISDVLKMKVGLLLKKIINIKYIVYL